MKPDPTPAPKIMNLKRPRGALTDEVMNCADISEARYKLNKIKCLRDDLRPSELLFMEYQMKLKYGYEEEAQMFLSDLLRQPIHKDFVYHIIYYSSLEFQRHGIDGIRIFRPMFMIYSFEQQREYFQVVIKQHPHQIIEILLTLLSLINDAVRRALTPKEAQPLVILQSRIIENAMKNEAHCKTIRGFWNLGQSLLKTQFHDISDGKIQFVYDLFIKSCLQECLCKSDDDSSQNRSSCTEQILKYVNKFGALVFFVKIMKKIDSTRLIPKTFMTFSIASEISSCIPAVWSPAMRPFLQFFLTGARIQLPYLNPDKLYLPSRKIMCIVPSREVPKLAESGFRDSFKGMSSLWLKICEFEHTHEVIKFVDSQLYYFFAFGHYYAERYSEVGKMEEYFSKEDLHYKVIRFCADLLCGKKPLKQMVELATIALSKGYDTFDPEFTDEFLVGTNKKCHHVLPKEKLGQWLLIIAPQALSLCGQDEDLLLIAQLLICQFEFPKMGKERLVYAWEEIKDKPSLKSVDLNKYIVKEAVIHRFVILSQRFETPWDPKECYQNLPKSISEQELLKLFLGFIKDHCGAV